MNLTIDEKMQLYEDFITGGGFYICKLLYERTPELLTAESHVPIPWGYLLCLYAEEEDVNLEATIKRYNDNFRCSENIIRLYSAVNYACELLACIDMENKSRFQHLYPDLITKTYGCGTERITNGYTEKNGNRTNFTADERLGRTRKEALSMLVQLIACNDYFETIEYDFTSEEAISTVNMIMQAIEKAKDDEILRKTIKGYRKMINEEDVAIYEEAILALLHDIEAGDIDINALGVNELSVTIVENGDIAEITASKQRSTSNYVLEINGKPVKSSKRPYFTINSGVIDSADSVKIRPERSFEDWYLVFEAGNKLHVKNLMLDLTNSKSNRFKRLYRMLFLAGGSLNSIKKVSPWQHEQIMKCIKGKHNSRRKSAWPLACIYMLFARQPV